MWATKNYRTFLENPLHVEKDTVWYGFTASNIIAPFFFEEMHDFHFEIGSVIGERHTDLLQNRIIPSLADKHLLESTILDLPVLQI